MADAENGQKIDPDATNVFDEEEFDDRIPYSVSYFMICIVLPVMNGLLNSFAWSAYALYARKNGWNLSLAGLAISIGCGGRLIVQQVIFRAGIWTCFIFAVVQLTVASMAIAYPAEAIVVYVQVACIPAFDVTVAIEGLAFDTWSDSEAQVGQAQSTVLSIFTIAYAMAATFGGVIYDAGSWTGISLFHLTCSLVQLLVFVAQPAMLKSFWEFIHRIRGDDDEDEDDEDEDEVKELGDQVTSIVPGPKVNVVPVSEASPLGPSAQSGPSGASGPSGPSGGKAEEMAALPGAVEEEAGPRATAPEKETQIVLPEKEVLPSDDPDGVQNAAHSEGDARAARAQASRRVSARSAASTKSSRRRKTANSESPEDDEEHERRSRALISPNLARSSIMTGHSSRSSVSSHVSQPRRRNQRLTVATHGTLATHRTGHTHASGRTANTTRSTRTMETVMTNLSKFTALTEMGEHFQYNFGIQNGLRPHIATNAVEMAVQSDDEEDAPAPRKTEVVGPRKSTAEKNKGLSKDLYVVAAMVVAWEAKTMREVNHALCEESAEAEEAEACRSHSDSEIDEEPLDLEPNQTPWWVSSLQRHTQHLGHPECQTRGPVKVLSACTGACAEGHVLQALRIPYLVMSASDGNMKCKEFARANLEVAPTHWFRPMRDQLNNACCTQHSHSVRCQAAPTLPDLSMIGAPCHPYSTQRAGRYASKSVESHPEYSVTFKDTLDMISMHTPKLVVSEQVQGFDKPIEAGSERTPYAMFVDALNALQIPHGYYLVKLNLDAKIWLNIRRPRIYMVFLRKDIFSVNDAKRFKDLALEVQDKQIKFVEENGPKPIEDILLPNSHEDLAALDSKRNRFFDAQELSGGNGEKQWKAQSSAWRSKLGVPMDFSPWTGRDNFVGRGFPRSKRAYDLVNCGWIEACKKKRLKITKNVTEEGINKQIHQSLIMDISQNHVRRPLSGEDSGPMRTLTTSSSLYHYRLDRMLVAKEHLLLQGYPEGICVPSSMTEDNVRKLAGEGIFLPCLGHVLWCLHLVRNLTMIWHQ